VVIALALAACSTATVTASHDFSAEAQPRPEIIYVADFDLEADTIKSEGLLSRLPMHALREEWNARSLVDVMGDSIVEDLGKKGFQAHRVPAGTALPPQGWLVRGAFLQVDEGNRLRRAIIGFGAGQTDVQVAVAVDNLSANQPPLPLYELETEAASGKLPGAVIKLNPYVAAAKFVLAGRDLDNGAKSSASKIAEEIVRRVSDGIPGTSRAPE
jgi:hypothetical protein